MRKVEFQYLSEENKNYETRFEFRLIYLFALLVSSSNLIVENLLWNLWWDVVKEIIVWILLWFVSEVLLPKLRKKLRKRTRYKIPLLRLAEPSYIHLREFPFRICKALFRIAPNLSKEFFGSFEGCLKAACLGADAWMEKWFINWPGELSKLLLKISPYCRELCRQQCI